MVASRAVFYLKLGEKGLRVVMDITQIHDTAEREAATLGMAHRQVPGLSALPPTSLSHTSPIFHQMTSQESRVTPLQYNHNQLLQMLCMLG